MHKNSMAPFLWREAGSQRWIDWHCELLFFFFLVCESILIILIIKQHNFLTKHWHTGGGGEKVQFIRRSLLQLFVCCWCHRPRLHLYYLECVCVVCVFPCGGCCIRFGRLCFYCIVWREEVSRLNPKPLNPLIPKPPKSLNPLNPYNP
jgi:hypothetical protein